MKGRKSWPTPTARDWKSRSKGKQGNARPLSEVIDDPGPLSPNWTEMLVGLPVGWTELTLTDAERKTLKDTLRAERGLRDQERLKAKASRLERSKESTSGRKGSRRSET